MKEDSGFQDVPAKQAGEDIHKSEPGGFNLKSILLFAAAGVLIFVLVNNWVSAGSNGGSFFAGGSCCSPGQSEQGVQRSASCCSPGGGAVTEEQLRQAGLDYYRINYGGEDVEAVVEDFGCHQEVHIYRDGELIHRLDYWNGEIYDRSSR